MRGADCDKPDQHLLESLRNVWLRVPCDAYRQRLDVDLRLRTWSRSGTVCVAVALGMPMS